MNIMSTQNGVTNLAGTTGASTTSPTIVEGGSANSLFGGVSKNDFLKLLVAQLRNQDPMRPMEDKEFIAQVAQLNTVEQMSNMNANLTELLIFEGVSQASTLIGKTIEAQTSGGKAVKGVVKEVSVEEGKPMLVVGDQEVAMADVQRITSA